jgi:hypothetical protein
MNLAELGNTPLSEQVDMANLPEQGGGPRTPPPPSGTYRFAIPRLTPEAFGPVTSETYGARVKVGFRGEFPLTIVQAPKAAEDTYLKAPFETTITNVPRKRGKGDDAPVVSDWDYLNRALGVAARPANNQAFAQTLIQLSQMSPAKEFSADVEGNYRCDETRDARFSDGNGAYVTVPAVDEAGQPVLDATGAPVNQKGCGKRFYEGQATEAGEPGRAGYIGKTNGGYPNSVECPSCQALIYRNANLTRFKP